MKEVFMSLFVRCLCAVCVLHFKIQRFLPQFQKAQALKTLENTRLSRVS